MKVSGEGRKRILLVDSVPTEAEDRCGKHLCPPRSDLLETILKECGVDMRKDCWITGAVCCRIPKDRPPNETHINACRPKLLHDIDSLKPHLVICLGTEAIESIVRHCFPPITKGADTLRGFVVPEQTLQCWVAFMLGVNTLNRTSFDPVVRVVMKRDMQNALDHLNYTRPYFSHAGSIETSTDTKRICRFLRNVLKRKPRIAIDYETTGLKPQAEGHRILCAAVAPSCNKSLSFPLLDGVSDLFCDVLQDSRIEKIAHNASFELMWSAVCAAPVRGKVWDTCLLAHLDDCRRGVAALDTQAYLRFGVPPWDTVEEFKRSVDKDKGANAFNKLDQVQLRQLMTYNAIDALYTAWLFDHFEAKGLAR